MKNVILDCYVSVSGEKPNEEQIQSVYASIPDEIKRLAYKWGWSDIAVREAIYALIKENLRVLSKIKGVV